MRVSGYIATLLVSIAGWLLAFVASPVAHAWDQHHELTRRALEGFKLRDPELWTRLTTPVTVTSIEQFVLKAFGPECTMRGLRDQVLEGVGKSYEVRYAESARARMQMLWEKGLSLAVYEFLPKDLAQNRQALGRKVSPLDVMAIYSDEPDWGMDDDVPRLKNVGITDGIEGMGTRVLRHFWYPGEMQVHVQMDKGQELDRRIQLAYELSQVAFSVGEPYWGYRFLAHALHYVGDLTQPFHVKGVISDEMVYLAEVARAALCEFGNRPGSSVRGANPRCTPELTILNATIKSGWLVGTYHSIYEDFGRGLLASDYHRSRSHVADLFGTLERSGDARELSIPRDARGALQLRPWVDAIQVKVLAEAAPVAADVYGLFGNRYRYEPLAARAELTLGGTDGAVGYRLAEADFYSFPLTSRQQELKRDLLERTHRLFERGGHWIRDLVRQGLLTGAPSGSDGSASGWTRVRRAEMARACLAPSR